MCTLYAPEQRAASWQDPEDMWQKQQLFPPSHHPQNAQKYLNFLHDLQGLELILESAKYSNIGKSATTNRHIKNWVSKNVIYK